MSNQESRRQFFRKYLLDLFDGVEIAFSEELKEADNNFPELIRPPGAGSEKEFLLKCQRCGKCIKACSFFAISAVTMGNSFDMRTPHLRVGQSFCRFCDNFPCIQACPHGALTRDESLTNRIATAKILPHACLRSGGDTCQACLDKCSGIAQAILISSNGPPAIDAARCTGCGACAAICPVAPEPAIRLIR